MQNARALSLEARNGRPLLKELKTTRIRIISLQAMEGLDISLSEDFSDPCVVVETVGNLYPELEFDSGDFGGQQTELADCTTSLSSPLSNTAGFRLDDDDEVDIETVDDGYTMAEKLTAQVIVEDVTETPQELPGEAIETEIVFPEMEQNGNLASMHHQNQDDFQIFGEYKCLY